MKHNPLHLRLIRLTNSVAAKGLFLLASIFAVISIALCFDSNGAKVLAIVIGLCDLVVCMEIALDLQRIQRSA